MNLDHEFWRHESDFGLCVGLDLPETFPDEGLDRLHPEERTYALALAPLRRTTWVGGRFALREALRRTGVETGPILQTPRGAPLLPAGVVGSISHKNRTAVALVDRAKGWGIGIDIEHLAPRREGIESKVLREEEREDRERLPEDRKWHDTILRFSIKEAIYKAIDPDVKRFVGFDEVAVFPHDDGGVEVLPHFPEPLIVEARWAAHGKTVIATARARR